MIKFLTESCLTRLPRKARAGRVDMDRFERTIGDLTLWMKPLIKAETFMNSQGRFFHYEPLFTSSFSKILIIPKAAMLSID